MIEIPDTFRGGEDVEEERYGERVSPFLSPCRPTMGSIEEHPKLPSGVQGRAQAENGFCGFWAQQNTSLTAWQAKTYKWPTAFWSTAWTATHLHVRDKFGTVFEIRDNSASRMTSYFFGTYPRNSGLSRKIRDGCHLIIGWNAIN